MKIWEVLTWAFTSTVESAAERSVLVAYAWRAGSKLTAWPGLDQLSKDTGFYRETISEARRALVARGLLVDTGERRGVSRRVTVYRLNVRQKPQIDPVDESIGYAAIAAHTAAPTSGNSVPDERQVPQMDERQKPHRTLEVEHDNEPVQARSAREEAHWLKGPGGEQAQGDCQSVSGSEAAAQRALLQARQARERQVPPPDGFMERARELLGRRGTG